MKFKYLIDVESRDLSRTLNNIEEKVEMVQIVNRTIVENLTYFDVLVGFEAKE
ncbi:hypothetical protein SAMN02745245_00266 [Anaerosphaera aminiphila DSM 21120]|uniref:Uncharacterized protein n=1 Tax=Anaerosphaera aminiphila DSM 21120 TaxID=1120995 RepID=A0A1M5PC49_9FIRM|nr:hypothetical protein [Anaerosphaera aminiphila]SHG99312.1 hypothetical protein SAMN02745245_00266 [Anaerosphaera aminiphila DSM 21120]